MRKYVGLHDVCKTQANVSIPEFRYAYVNAEIHMLTHCLYNDKLMLIFPNIKIPRQNTCLHTICEAQVNVNIPKYTYADVNATVRMLYYACKMLVTVNISGYKCTDVKAAINTFTYHM